VGNVAGRARWKGSGEDEATCSGVVVVGGSVWLCGSGNAQWTRRGGDGGEACWRGRGWRGLVVGERGRGREEGNEWKEEER
jgi:hypothetical protein